MITADDKDKVLMYFVSEFPDLKGSFSSYELSEILGLSVPVVGGIIQYLCDIKLIRVYYTNMDNLVTISVSAHDLMGRGGFKAQEELLKENINKLGLELESLSKSLQPDLLDKANKLSSIASQILTSLSLFTNSK